MNSLSLYMVYPDSIKPTRSVAGLLLLVWVFLEDAQRTTNGLRDWIYISYTWIRWARCSALCNRARDLSMREKSSAVNNVCLVLMIIAAFRALRGHLTDVDCVSFCMYVCIDYY